MKVWLIVAGALVLAGILLFVGTIVAFRFDFTRFNTVQYETKIYEVSDDFSSISLSEDTADITLIPYEGETAKIECFLQKKMTHDVAVEDGELKVAISDGRAWYDHITFFSVSTPSVKVYLPKTEYRAITVRTDTGDVVIPKELSAERIEIATSTGDIACYASATGEIALRASTGYITVENVAAGKLTLSASTGDITASSVTCTGDALLKVTTGKVTLSSLTCTGDVSLKVSTGKAFFTDVSCRNLSSDGNTGNLSLVRVLVSERLSAERSTGDVKMEDCDFGELWIKTDTGDVEGTLRSEKIVFAHTDTGKIEVPHSTSGGRCEITTDTGDIKISIQN